MLRLSVQPSASRRQFKFKLPRVLGIVLGLVDRKPAPFHVDLHRRQEPIGGHHTGQGFFAENIDELVRGREAIAGLLTSTVKRP